MASSGFTWLRLHQEARNDAKLRSLDDRQFRVWFNLLCFAGEQPTRGVIAGIDVELLAIEVASGDSDLLAGTLDRLERVKIIARADDAITFINFNKRQYDKPSDVPERVSERVAKHRQRQRNADETPQEPEETPSGDGETPCNADETRSNATDTNSETDTDTEGLRPPEGPPSAPDDKTKAQAKKAEKRPARIGEEFQPSVALIDWAKTELGLDAEWIRSETEKFRDYWAAEGKPKKDWEAAWRYWMRRSLERPPGRASPGRASPAPPVSEPTPFSTKPTETPEEQEAFRQRFYQAGS